MNCAANSFYSQGGPTIQYIEAITPQTVASLTAIAGAMKGTPIMEIGRNSPVLKPWLSALSTVLGHSMYALTGNNYPVSAKDSMLALSTTEMEKFNQKYGSTAITKDCHSNGDKVTKNGIYHYSWIGNQQATNALDVVESTVVTLVSQPLKAARFIKLKRFRHKKCA